MREKILLLCFFIFSAFGHNILGQELLRKLCPVDFEISVKTLPEKSSGRVMFNALALNNGKSIGQLKQRFQASIFVNLYSDTAAKQFVTLKVLNQQLIGDIHFRDFALDSLLSPAQLEGSVFFQMTGHTVLHLPFILPLSSEKYTIELPDSINFIGDDLSIDIQIEGIAYEPNQEAAFFEVTGLINFYCSYNKILKELISQFGVLSINRKQDASVIFVARHQIQRVNAYIQQHDFINILSLEMNDPLGFLLAYSMSLRMEKRAGTFFRQIINSRESVEPGDKKKYCEAYGELSQMYFDRTLQLQPYLASGFEELIQIYPSQVEQQSIAEIASFYDVFNHLDTKSVPQLIYAQFISLAHSAFDKSQYVTTLQMLQNAAQIEVWFDDVLHSENYSVFYDQSIDGLLAANLSVSINAYKLKKRDMAEKYYQKAQSILTEYMRSLFENGSNHQPLLNFTEQQIKLSGLLIDDGEYKNALLILNQAKSIRQQKSIIRNCPQIDSLISLSLRGILYQKLDAVDRRIVEKKYDLAVLYLDSTKQYMDGHTPCFDTFPTREFENRASILFDAFYNRGEGLLQSKRPEEALSSFIQATEVERKYLSTQNTHLKILVYNATIPVILSQIEKASFETWANRMGNADSIYQGAKQMQHRYKQDENVELNTAFLLLETKMKERKCVDLIYRIEHLNVLIVNRVQSKKFDAAEEFLQEAKSIIHNSKNCKIDGTQIQKLEAKCAPLFNYQHQQKQAAEFVIEMKYDSAIAQFSTLTDYFGENRLEKFAIEKPDLFGFVEDNNKPELSEAAVLFIVQDSDYLEAVRYLKLLKDQGVQASSLKEIQRKVGNGIGLLERKQDVADQVFLLTEGDKWFHYFELARLEILNWN